MIPNELTSLVTDVKRFKEENCVSDGEIGVANDFIIIVGDALLRRERDKFWEEQEIKNKGIDPENFVSES